MKTKNRILPIILTFLILIIIVYLFINIKQPLVECEKTITSDSLISVKENLATTFSGNKITKMELTKTIVLPEKYQNDSTINYIKEALDKAYDYLNNTKSKDVVTLRIKDKYTEGEFMTHLKNNGYVCKWT